MRLAIMGTDHVGLVVSCVDKDARKVKNSRLA
jgi:hypothetical protein